jgi:crooked neck
VELLNAWRSFEQAHGREDDKQKIEKQMPRKVKKRRRLEEDRFEEYVDYVFPGDDEGAAKMAKLLQRAHAWKAMQQQNGSAANGVHDDETNGSAD